MTKLTLFDSRDHRLCIVVLVRWDLVDGCCLALRRHLGGPTYQLSALSCGVPRD